MNIGQELVYALVPLVVFSGGVSFVITSFRRSVT